MLIYGYRLHDRANFSVGGFFPDPGLLILFEVDRQIGLPHSYCRGTE